VKSSVCIFSACKILNRLSVTLFPEDTVKQTPANPRNAPTKARKRRAVQRSLRIHLHLGSASDTKARWSSRESLRSSSLHLLHSVSYDLSRKRCRFCLEPCNQSFNSYCTRKHIIRRCVLYDGGRNIQRSSASKMLVTCRGAHVQRNNGEPRTYVISPFHTSDVF